MSQWWGKSYYYLMRYSVTCLDLPYHCDDNAHTAQPQWGVIVVFKLLGHTRISVACVHAYEMED